MNALLRRLFGWLRDGALRLRIAESYPRERGGEAIAALMERRVSGKRVVVPAPESA